MFAAGAALSAVLTWAVVRGVDVRAFLKALSEIDVAWIVLGGIVIIVGDWIRAWRWALLLSPRSRMKLFGLFKALAIGELSNFVLPFRGGEVVRVFAVRHPGVSFSTLAGSVVLERVIDMAFVAVILLVCLVALKLPLPLGRYLVVFELAVVAASFLLFFLVKYWDAVASFLWRIGGRFGSHPQDGKIGDHFNRFLLAFGALLEGGRPLQILGLTLLIWGIQILVIWLGLRSLRIEAEVLVSGLALGLVVAGMFFPSLPGGVGTYEFMVVTALRVQGIGTDQALAGAVVLHGLAFAVSILLGVFSLICNGSGAMALFRVPSSEDFAPKKADIRVGAE